jgi:hypothetical protein
MLTVQRLQKSMLQLLRKWTLYRQADCSSAKRTGIAPCYNQEITNFMQKNITTSLKRIQEEYIDPHFGVINYLLVKKGE